MINYERILVVVDAHSDVHLTMSKAVVLAKGAGAHLDLVICQYDDHLAGTRFGDSDQLRKSRTKLLETARLRLENLAAPLREAGLNVDVHTVFDHPLHQAIIDIAGKLRSDLVVKETHFHHLLSRSVFSNTDWELIRAAPFNLLLCKSDEWADQAVFLAAVDPLHTGDKSATLDHTIMRQAIAMAASVNGLLRVVHCFPIMASAAVAGTGMMMPAPVDSAELDSCVEKTHRSALDKLVSEYKIPAAAVFLVSGEPRRRLIDMARALNADVTVVGAVSRGRIKEAFLGFTALHVLDRLPCDLLIVKNPKDFT